jgi:hypothetical protein
MKNLLVLSLLLLLVACEPIPRVKVSGGNPPTFTVSRTGLAYFEVCCKEEFAPHNEQNNLWKINSTSDVKLPLEIAYGIVPTGFKQVIPDNGQTSALVEGRKYKYEAMGSWGAKIGCFQIQGGKAIDVECDDPNLSLTARIEEGKKSFSFIIDGSDTVYDFSVCYHVDGGECVWRIKPDAQHRGTLPVDIPYGVLPKGYTQLEPASNSTPQKLKEGIKYIYYLRGIYSNDKGCFEIINGRIHKIDCY